MIVLKSVDGIFRSGRIEVSALPQGVVDGTPLIVTFLNIERAAGRDVGGLWQVPVAQRSRPLFAQGWYRPELESDPDRTSATLLMW